MRQVAFESEQPARAKHAAHGAADLRAEANGPAVGLAHQHALDMAAVLEPQQQFFRAVAGHLVPHDFRRRKAENRPTRPARSGLDRSCICSKSATRLPKIQRRIWSARNGASPRRPHHSASSARDKSVRRRFCSGSDIKNPRAKSSPWPHCTRWMRGTERNALRNEFRPFDRLVNAAISAGPSRGTGRSGTATRMQGPIPSAAVPGAARAGIEPGSLPV